MTTGIFPPESGGPATYTPVLARKLTNRGHTVHIITYSSRPEYDFDADYPFTKERIVRHGTISNYWRFFRAVNRQIADFDLVYTLDWTAAGFPVSCAARMRNIPYAVRVGGGYIWERYLDAREKPMSLREFYKQDLYKTYPALFSMIKFVFGAAQKIVFNTDIQPEIFKKPYALEDGQMTTIYNPMPDTQPDITREESNDEVVFAGRLIEMKNVTSLVKAFANANTNKRLIIIGDGPQKEAIQSLIQKLKITERVQMYPAMEQDELFERIINAHLVVQPSWTDISPNLIYECLALDIPFLVTKENFMSIRDQISLMVDPHSVDDIAEKIEHLEDPNNYNEYTNQLKQISVENNWKHVTNRHERLFKEMTL